MDGTSAKGWRVEGKKEWGWRWACVYIPTPPRTHIRVHATIDIGSKVTKAPCGDSFGRRLMIYVDVGPSCRRKAREASTTPSLPVVPDGSFLFPPPLPLSSFPVDMALRRLLLTLDDLGTMRRDELIRKEKESSQVGNGKDGHCSSMPPIPTNVNGEREGGARRGEGVSLTDCDDKKTATASSSLENK